MSDRRPPSPRSGAGPRPSVRIASREEARAASERDSDFTGQRHGKTAMMLVIVLVFSTLAPLMLLFGLVYFAIGRVVYCYLLCFAEPPRNDLGGEFWAHLVDQARSTAEAGVGGR